MIYDRILVRYGDLVLKGKNRHEFSNRVHSLTAEKLQGLNVTIDKRHDRLFIKLNDEDPAKVIAGLNRVTGVLSYSLVATCESTLESINRTANALVAHEIKAPTTFKVASKRADKTFPYTSQEITKKVANAIIREHHELLTVDVKNPERELFVELRKEATYLFLDEIPGLRGFPVGSAGKGLLMMSGGIDSAVAGFLAMKHGIEIDVFHFESSPLTPIESAQKVIELTKKIAIFAPRSMIKLHFVPFREAHERIIEKVADFYSITIMRRLMYRIAEKFAQDQGHLVLINGESVGQVASQTLESMVTINEVTCMPVLRPLVTMDKQDIIEIAKTLDTYRISIQPHDDCCTIYQPKTPVTKPNIEKARYHERRLNIEALVETCVSGITTIEITPSTNIDLSVLGFELKTISWL